MNIQVASLQTCTAVDAHGVVGLGLGCTMGCTTECVDSSAGGAAPMVEDEVCTSTAGVAGSVPSTELEKPHSARPVREVVTARSASSSASSTWLGGVRGGAQEWGLFFPPRLCLHCRLPAHSGGSPWKPHHKRRCCHRREPDRFFLLCWLLGGSLPA